jgi:hypothetical protein
VFLPGQDLIQFTPLTDGQPTLRGHSVQQACWAEATLALAVRQQVANAGSPSQLLLYQLPDGLFLANYRQAPNQKVFALSSDGQFLARQDGPTHVEIRPTNGPRRDRVCTARAGFHHGILVALGDRWLGLLVENRIFRLISWHQGQLILEVRQEGTWKHYLEAKDGEFVCSNDPLARQALLPDWVAYDPRRFLNTVKGNLIVVVDRYGQIFLFTRLGDLVCAIFAWHTELAVWTPDGHCHGPERLLGRRTTPDALQQIGQRLLQASTAGRKA